jgi:hypothetical protein
MTQLKGTNLSGNATFIYAPADIENAQGSQAGTNNGDMIPPTWVGSGFMSHQMNDTSPLVLVICSIWFSNQLRKLIPRPLFWR